MIFVNPFIHLLIDLITHYLNHYSLHCICDTFRSNSSDSAIILPFIDSDNENIVSLDSGVSKFTFLQKNHSDNYSEMDVVQNIEYNSYSGVWPQSRKTTSISCPHLEAPSVVISDHSTDEVYLYIAFEIKS